MNEFLGMVVAQAICFILFYAVLKWLAWKPVLQFLEERRSRISEEFDKIEAMSRQTKETQSQLNERLAKIEDEARARVQEAIVEGRKTAEQIAERARADAQDIRAHAQTMAEVEFAKAMEQIKNDVVRMTILATERLLREKMDDARHREMVGRFLTEIEKN